VASSNKRRYKDYEYTLIRAKRISIELRINNGSIEVRAPYFYSKKDVDEFVASREKWIIKHLEQSTQQANDRKSFSLDYGDTVYLFGEPHVLKESEDKGWIKHGFTDCLFDDEILYLRPGLTPEQIKQTCIRIYRTMAAGHCIPRTHELAKIMSVTPGNIRISNAKSRWGSCSSKGSINYPWRLMMADDDAIDYLIVHELAHLIEMNHSKKFWSIVERYIPDYRERQKRLKQLQRRLVAENWD